MNEKLRKLIDETGLSDADVARRIGFNHRQQLQNYVSGRRIPHRVNRKRIAETLTVLLGREIKPDQF